MTLHPTACVEIAHTALLPIALQLSNDPAQHHFREPTQRLFFQLERPFHSLSWQLGASQGKYSHLQFIDKRGHDDGTVVGVNYSAS